MRRSGAISTDLDPNEGPSRPILAYSQNASDHPADSGSSDVTSRLLHGRMPFPTRVSALAVALVIGSATLVSCTPTGRIRYLVGNALFIP